MFKIGDKVVIQPEKMYKYLNNGKIGTVVEVFNQGKTTFIKAHFSGVGEYTYFLSELRYPTFKELIKEAQEKHGQRTTPALHP